MTLFERLYEDMKLAMKAHDDVRLQVLRMSIAACKNYKIEKYGVSEHELSDEEVINVLTKQIKQRKDAAAGYVSAGRQDYADKEHHEASLIQGYVPPLLTEDELATIVSQTQKELGVTSIAEMGTLMKAVMAKVKGKADGNDVSRLVKNVLSV